MSPVFRRRTGLVTLGLRPMPLLTILPDLGKSTGKSFRLGTLMIQDARMPRTQLLAALIIMSLQIY